jgi:hypothetical protein
MKVIDICPKVARLVNGMVDQVGGVDAARAAVNAFAQLLG